MTAGRTLIPVTLLTGYLGSGKTTLLTHLLASPALANAAVLINEIGEIGLDHLLVREVKEDFVLLKSGCLCCTVRSDMIHALRELLFGRGRDGIPKFERVLIETTGLADPAPILHTLIEDPHVAHHYRFDGLVSTVDGVFGMRQLDAHPEPIKQAAMADRVVITKCDLADAPALDALEQRLRALNPAAPVYRAKLGRIDASALLDAGLYNATTKSADVARWLAVERVAAHEHAHAHGHHDERINTFTVAFDAPIEWLELQESLDLLLSLHGERVLRIKGLLDLAGESAPHVLHAVQHVIYPLARLPTWPEGKRASRLVFITRDLAPDSVRKTLAAFVSGARVSDARATT